MRRSPSFATSSPTSTGTARVAAANPANAKVEAGVVTTSISTSKAGRRHLLLVYRGKRQALGTPS